MVSEGLASTFNWWNQNGFEQDSFDVRVKGKGKKGTLGKKTRRSKGSEKRKFRTGVKDEERIWLQAPGMMWTEEST